MTVASSAAEISAMPGIEAAVRFAHDQLDRQLGWSGNRLNAAPRQVLALVSDCFVVGQLWKFHEQLNMPSPAYMRAFKAAVRVKMDQGMGFEDANRHVSDLYAAFTRKGTSARQLIEYCRRADTSKRIVESVVQDQIKAGAGRKAANDRGEAQVRHIAIGVSAAVAVLGAGFLLWHGF